MDMDADHASTFDDVFDVGPVGYYVEDVFWWTAGFHCEDEISWERELLYIGWRGKETEIRMLTSYMPRQLHKVDVVRHGCV